MRLGMVAGIALLTAAGTLVWALVPRGVKEVPAASMERLPVRVEGTISRGGHPSPDLRVAFVSRNGKSLETTTDKFGHYAIGLASAGTYQMAIKPLPHLTSTLHSVTLKEGTNRFDLELPLTQLGLRFMSGGRPLTEPVEVTLHGPAADELHDWSGVVLPSDQPASLVGMRFGRYTINAATPRGSVSKASTVANLEVSSPSATVTLELAPRSLEARISTSDHRPLRNLQVRAWAHDLAAPADGVVNLSRIPAGEPLLVAASGYLPACRTIPGTQSRMDVELVRSGRGSSRVTLIGERLASPKGQLSGLAGSDCAVPVSLLHTTIVKPVEPGRLSFQIDSLPDGHYSFAADAWAPQTSLDIPGAAIEYRLPPRCAVCG